MLKGLVTALFEVVELTERRTRSEELQDIGWFRMRDFLSLSIPLQYSIIDLLNAAAALYFSFAVMGQIS